jgi:Protein kinase domain/WD40-like Beta Propeller Repeat
MPARSIKRLDDGLPAGTHLGPYEVVSPLGAGGMGRVYRALDRRLRREVAIKTLDEESAADPRRRRRFEREAQAASVVGHPHVLMVLDIGEWEGRPYLVTELLEGCPLRAYLRPGLLSFRQAVDYATQLCRGLQAIHERGIVHHDLKPENVFVTEDGWVKILDLGLAGPSPGEAAEWLHTTEDGAAGGTTAYMAPEQVRRQPTDARTDVFAVGVMLYEMLGRRRPFAEETAAETMTAILRREPTPLEQIDPALPPSLVRVVDRCLRKRPEDRFHSAHDLSLALEASLADAPRAPRSARAVEILHSAYGPRRRGLTAWSLAAAVALVFAANLWLPKPGRSAREDVVLAGIVHPTLVRYDAAHRRFAPFLAGAAIEGVETSRDGRWIAYTTYPQGELWRANADGGEPVKLTSSPLRAALPRWSPDGTRIAFAAHAPERPWQVHVMPAAGGPLEVLGPEKMIDPGWTPDGRAIVMGMLSSEPGAIFEWDLESRRMTIVPGSYGLFSPRPSPDGRYLAALDVKTWQLAIRDQRTETWSRHGAPGAGYPTWSRDGSWLHFRRDGTFSRVDPASGREELLATLNGAVMVGGEWGAWTGLAPDESPLVLISKDPS